MALVFNGKMGGGDGGGEGGRWGWGYIFSFGNVSDVAI